MIRQIKYSLEQATKSIAKIGKVVNDSILGETFIFTAKAMFVGLVLGLIATVAVLTFTAIIMAIL